MHFVISYLKYFTIHIQKYVVYLNKVATQRIYIFLLLFKVLRSIRRDNCYHRTDDSSSYCSNLLSEKS